MDTLREREYPLLDLYGHVYLDYTAVNLCPSSLVERHLALLKSHAGQVQQANRAQDSHVGDLAGFVDGGFPSRESAAAAIGRRVEYSV